MDKVSVCIIDQNIMGAILVKQSLEGTGRFGVTPFADPFAALDYLRQELQQVVVVDMGLSGYPGDELIRAVLEIQPDVVVFASMEDMSVATRALQAGAAQILGSGYKGRELMGIIDQILGSPMADPVETDLEPPLDEEDTGRSESSGVFERLAAEEPPSPTFEDSGTVTDFMAVSQDQIDDMLNDIEEDDLAANRDVFDGALDEMDETDEGDTPAKMILEAAGDEELTLDELPFDKYIAAVRVHNEKHAGSYVKEPDFLSDPDFWDDLGVQDDSPVDELEALGELGGEEENKVRAAAVTREVEVVDAESVDDDLESLLANDVAEVEEAPSVEMTSEDVPEIIENVDEDVEDVPETIENVDEDVEDVPEPITDDLEWEVVAEADEGDDLAAFTAMLDSFGNDNEADGDLDDEDIELIPLAEDMDDPRVTQMAVSLTQASLESTAEATLLTRGEDFVAYEGGLSDADIAEFLGVITDGWEDVGESNARIRYLTLSSNGLDYMIYSRRTYENFILSMVFAGKTPLRDIRQQGKRIVEALRDVPEQVVEPEPEVDAEPEAAVTKPSRGGILLEAGPATENAPLVEHAFVWLLEDPNKALAYSTAEAINAGLRIQLVERGWKVNTLDVEEDYVYLLAGVPGDVPLQTIVRDLQIRAAKIATTADASLKPDGLWAESYFVLSPGRELNMQEIQQYINFYRM